MALHHVKSGEPVDLQPLGPNLKNAKTAAIIKPQDQPAREAPAPDVRFWL